MKKKTVEKKATTAEPNSPISRHSQSPSGSRQVTAIDANNKQSLSDLVDLDLSDGRNSISVNIVDPFSELDKELHSIGLSPRGPMTMAPVTPSKDVNNNPIIPTQIEAPSSMSAIDVLQHNVLNRYYKKDLLQDKYSKSTTDLEWDEMNPSRAAHAAAAAAAEGQKHGDGARIQLRSAARTDDMSDGPKTDSDLKQKTGCCLIL